MLTDYERYQLEWMIEHGHSLDELMDELTYCNRYPDGVVSLHHLPFDIQYRVS